MYNEKGKKHFLTHDLKIMLNAYWSKTDKLKDQLDILLQNGPHAKS